MAAAPPSADAHHIVASTLLDDSDPGKNRGSSNSVPESASPDLAANPGLRFKLFPRDRDGDSDHAVHEVEEGIFIADYHALARQPSVSSGSSSSILRQIDPVVIIGVGQEFQKLQERGALPAAILRPKSTDGNGNAMGTYFNATKLLELGEVLEVDDDCREPEGTPQSELDVKSLEDLDEAVHIIERSMGDCSACRKKNSNAVIFCSSGLNKSVVVAIAFLMRYRAYSLAEAFEKVWGIRAGAWPSVHFMGLLVAYEASLFRNTLPIVVGQLTSPSDGPAQVGLRWMTDYADRTEEGKSIVEPVFAREKAFRDQILFAK